MTSSRLNLSILCTLFLFLVACGTHPSQSEFTRQELRKEYVDSLCNYLAKKVIPFDSSLYLGNKVKRISEEINYEQGIVLAELEIGKAYSANNNIEVSDSILNEVLQSSLLDSSQYGRAFLYLGRNRFSERNLAGADSLMNISYAYARNDPALRYSALLNSATIHSIRKDFQRALRKLEEAGDYLKFRTSSKDSGSYYNFLGTTVVFSGQIEEGEAYLRKGLGIFEKIGDSLDISRAYTSLFTTAMTKGDLLEALDYSQASIRYYPADADTLFLAKYYKNQGMILREIGRHDEALGAYWKAHGLMEAAGDEMGEVRTKISLGSMYELLGDHASSIACLREAADHPKIEENPVTLATCYTNLAHLMRKSGNLPEALELGEKAVALLGEKGSPILQGRLNIDLGRTYQEMQKLPEARSQFGAVLAQVKAPGIRALESEAHTALGILDLEEGKYKQALNHAKESYDRMREEPSQSSRLENLVLFMDAHFNLGDNLQAQKWGEKAWDLAVELESNMRKREISEKLSRIYEKAGKSGQALAFARIHQNLEALYAAEEQEKLIHELRAQMELDQKNSEINMLFKETQVQDEKLNSRKLLIVILGLLAVGLVLFFVFWQKRTRLLQKNNLLEMEVQHSKDRLEMENAMNEMRLLALQARLNPHFVFNCLVVLQSLTQRGEKATALKYIGSFSRLTRRVFEISQNPSLSLEEEIEFLKLYIQLESRRLGEEVAIKVEIGAQLDPETTFIPPLLLQPIVENCFKHGFSRHEGPKEIRLSFQPVAGALECSISDNGRGISGPIDPGRPSGTRITRKRLEILSGEEHELEDDLLLQANANGPGTTARLKVPLVPA